MHLVGVDGMPRRVADYAHEFATINAIISISSFLFGLSFLIFVYNIVASWRHGPPAPANPWRGRQPRRDAGPRHPAAGALARVAGLLAAADLQLRRGADRRGRPVRVRRPGRGARCLQEAR